MKRVWNILSNKVNASYLRIKLRGLLRIWKISRRSFSNCKTIKMLKVFLASSWADLRWSEFVEIIWEHNSLVLTLEDVGHLDYFEKCNVLNSSAVLSACHFQYKGEIFFKEILHLEAKPLRKVKYYPKRVEYQFRGLPHIHILFWTLNAPNLNENSINEYADFLYSVFFKTHHQNKRIHIYTNYLRHFKYTVFKNMP